MWLLLFVEMVVVMVFILCRKYFPLAKWKLKYYDVNNLKADRKCKLPTELLNCTMALYQQINWLIKQLC